MSGTTTRPCTVLVGMLAALLLFTGQLAIAQNDAAGDAATRQYNAAAALQNRQQFDLAIDEWNRFLDAYPQDSRATRARYYLGVCQFAVGKNAEAVAALSKVVADAKDFDQLDGAHLYLGLAQFNLARAGDAKLYQTAADTLAQLATKYPNSTHRARGLYYQAEALYAAGKKPDAVALYGELAEKFPSDPLHAEALYALGVTQQELNQRGQALAAFSRFINTYPNHAHAAEVSMRQAEVLLADGKVADAIPLFTKAAEQPGFAFADRALAGLAGCYYQQEKFADAAKTYGRLVREHPKSELAAAAQRSAGECAYRAGDYAQATSWLEPLAGGTGDVALSASHWLVRTQLTLGKPEQGLATADAALKRAAGSALEPQLTMDRIDCLYELPTRRSESGRAYAEFAQKFAESPLAAEAAYMAALVALGEQDYEAALARAVAFEKRYAETTWAPDVTLIAAESELRLGRHLKAEARYAQLLKQRPNDPQANAWRLRQGLCLLLAKQYDRVQPLLDPTLASLTKPEEKAEALYLLGSAAYERRQYEPAIRHLEASLAAAPKGEQADESLLVLAYALHERGDTKAAIKRLEQLVEQFPASATQPRALFRLGEYRMANEDFAGAAEAYKKVISGAADSSLTASAQYGLALCQIKLRDPESAVAPLTAAIDSAPDAALAARARLARARALEQLRRYSHAIDDLQAFLAGKHDRGPTSEALHLLGLCQEGIGKSADAAQTYRKLLKEDPKYADADKVWYALAWSLKDAGKESESVEAFAELGTKFGKSPLAAEAHFHVAESLYAKANYADAVRSFYNSMSVAGKTELGERAAHRMGWAYYRNNDASNARKTFAYQRSTWPNGPLASDAAFMEGEAIFKLAEATADPAARNRLWGEAVAAYEQVKQPSQSEFQLLAMLHAARALGQAGEWERSLKWIQTAVAADQAKSLAAELTFEEAQARLNLNQADQALPLYERVTELSSDEVAARARFAVGEIYFQRKDHREAIRNFFKVGVYGFAEWSAAAGYETGRCFEVLGDATQARQSYQEVVDKYPQTKWAEAAGQRLKQLAAR